jgi:hypothetical protein
VESTASEASTKAAAMETPTAKAAAMETATTKAASVTAATTAASGRRGWLNQADSHRCEQGYNRFPHHASFLGTMSPPRVKHFRTVIIRQSKSVRGKLTVSQGSSIILRMHPNVRADSHISVGLIMCTGGEYAASGKIGTSGPPIRRLTRPKR